MSQNTNIWQVTIFDDLLYHLRKGSKKIIVLSLVLLNTDNNVKNRIKKLMTEKASQYPNIVFIYYVVRHEDFGRKLNIIDKDITQYPIMYHIFDMRDILCHIAKIDDAVTLRNYFKKTEDLYLNSTNEDNFSNNENEDGNGNEVLEESKIRPVNDIIVPSAQTNQETQLLEQKKFTEKLILLRKKADEYTFSFLEEIAKRKKEEEKHKKKKHTNDK
jgi:hypothetical protein